MVDGSVVILILDRGRTLVGRLSRHPDLAFHWRMAGARVVRRWGTTEGLEQIAADGPTADTVLDRPCNVTVPFSAVVEILDCVEASWTATLSGSSPARQRATR